MLAISMFVMVGPHRGIDPRDAHLWRWMTFFIFPAVQLSSASFTLILLVEKTVETLGQYCGYSMTDPGNGSGNRGHTMEKAVKTSAIEVERH